MPFTDPQWFSTTAPSIEEICEIYEVPRVANDNNVFDDLPIDQASSPVNELLEDAVHGGGISGDSWPRNMLDRGKICIEIYKTQLKRRHTFTFFNISV